MTEEEQNAFDVITRNLATLHDIDDALGAIPGNPKNAILGKIYGDTKIPKRPGLLKRAANALKSSPDTKGNGKDLASQEDIDDAVRIRYRIIKVPTVQYNKCECGDQMVSPDGRIVKLAQLGHDLPPIRCDCGRVLIGVRSKIILSGKMQ